MPRESRQRWRALLPDRWSWLQLLASPSTYLLTLALVLTMAAKLPVIRGYQEMDFWPSPWLVACSRDVLFFFGLGAILAFGESVRRWVIALTVPIALVVTFVAVVNVGYMSISGEQLSWQILTLGIDRFGDVSTIANATLFSHPIRFVLVVVLLGALPFGARWLVQRKHAVPAREAGASRARAMGSVAVFALLVVLIVPKPQQYALARIYENAVVRTYWGMVTGSGNWNNASGGFFAGYEPHDLVDAPTIETLRGSARPNVIVVVLESVRRDETTLPGARGLAATPNIAAIAAAGTDFVHARSVIPQTTKSVWSMMCGRIPLLQTKVYETSSTVDVQCIPDILTAAGYRTAFFQSAIGHFEDRPRLVNAMGFQSYTSLEDITKEVTGYLSSDDELMLPPVTSWIDAGQGAPFMTMVLTSSTHHPYELSADRAEKVRQSGRPAETDRDRYDRELEAGDALIGGIVSHLRERGLLERTIIVVVGDHGEGFGEKGTRQHGSNFYEEGLRVPWVMMGPGVPKQSITRNVALFDVTATLLHLLGVEPSAAARAAIPSKNVLGDVPERALPFSCYYDNACRGFVYGTTKVVTVPETGQTFAFDLDKDPDEASPRPLRPEERTKLTTVVDVIEAHRASTWLLKKDEMTAYPRWLCRANQNCRIKR